MTPKMAERKRTVMNELMIENQWISTSDISRYVSQREAHATSLSSNRTPYDHMTFIFSSSFISLLNRTGGGNVGVPLAIGFPVPFITRRGCGGVGAHHYSASASQLEHDGCADASARVHGNTCTRVLVPSLAVDKVYRRDAAHPRPGGAGRELLIRLTFLPCLCRWCTSACPGRRGTRPRRNCLP